MSSHDACDARARGHGRVDVAVPRDQLPRVVAVGALAQQEQQLPALARLQHAADVERGAGIQRRADLRRTASRAGSGRPAVTASPLRPMNERRSAGEGRRRLARVRERDVAGELLVVGVASRGSPRVARSQRR